MVRGLRIERINMKQYTTIKIGYSVGVYGCSNEFFTTIYINGSKNGSFSFYGMYGAEERINRAMEAKGYKGFYTQSHYGRMVREDSRCIKQSEYMAINYINRTFKHSKEEITQEKKELDKIIADIHKNE
jgi:hypothetical protein